MKSLSGFILTTIVAGIAVISWTSAGAWWNDDHDDYYYDHPWHGGRWYGGYPGYGWGGYPGYGWGGYPDYGWGGYPGYGWGGYPGYYGGSPVIRIITAPVAPDSDQSDASTVH
jgi:hypothetical protein